MFYKKILNYINKDDAEFIYSALDIDNLAKFHCADYDSYINILERIIISIKVMCSNLSLMVLIVLQCPSNWDLRRRLLRI